MRHRWMRTALALAIGCTLGSKSYAQTGTYDIPGNPAINVPLPIGPTKASDGGFYAALEVVMLDQSRALGSQTVAVRGFRDSLGTFTGTPGTFVGSGVEALNTSMIGRGTWNPGYEITLGYKFESGIAVQWTYLSVLESKYTAGASGPGIGGVAFNGNAPQGPANENTYLYSNVFNFTPFFSGPPIRTFDDQFSADNDPFPITGRLYGIWNGSTYMDISYIQRFTASDMTVRIPVLETDYSRTYALAGGRFAWFFERFRWRTAATSLDGNLSAEDVALYTNTLSQRMYGPFIGCSNEVYVGSGFAFSVDTTGSLLVDLAKMRAKYEREDQFTQSKRSRDEFTIVPNVNAKFSLSWYPLQGVSIRASYLAQTFFNTYEMSQPIGFNFGGVDPIYQHRTLRLVHGAELGIGISF